MLIGYIGQNLSSTQTKKGDKRVMLRVATHYAKKTDSGEKQWLTVWHDVIAWNNTAVFAERNFVKGSKIMVDGSITYRTYEDLTGHTRYVTEITAHSLQNLDR